MDKIVIDTPSDWYGIIMIYTSNQPIGYIIKVIGIFIEN